MNIHRIEEALRGLSDISCILQARATAFKLLNLDEMASRLEQSSNDLEMWVAEIREALK